jgi:hypothetical protein
MDRRHVVTAVTVALAAAAVVPAAGASAAKPPKVKVMKGSYALTLPPDPTMEATGAAGKECFNVDPASADNHALTLPGKGTLHVVLDSANVQGKTDWDLYVLDAAGSTIDSSHGPSSHEETTDPGVGKGKVTIRACNLLGEPAATVSYTFTYR